MPDCDLGHDKKAIIFMLLCEPIAHVDSCEGGNPDIVPPLILFNFFTNEHKNDKNSFQ